MLKKFILHTILIFTAISMLAPFLVMVLISISTGNQISFNDINGTLQHLTLNNYVHVNNTIPIIRYFFNSLIVSIFTTLGQIIISTLAGYAFARLDFKFRNTLFFIILITIRSMDKDGR